MRIEWYWHGGVVLICMCVWGACVLKGTGKEDAALRRQELEKIVEHALFREYPEVQQQHEGIIYNIYVSIYIYICTYIYIYI